MSVLLSNLLLLVTGFVVLLSCCCDGFSINILHHIYLRVTSSSSHTFGKDPFSSSIHKSSNQRSSSCQTTTTSSTSLYLALTLFGHPGTRSPLINWALHELELDFDMGDLSKNPHPFGQMPCLTDDSTDGPVVVVFESGAILQYLLRYHTSESSTFSPLSQSDIGLIMSWITWANASLDPICFLETPNGKVYDTGLRNRNQKRLKQLDTLLSQQPYLIGTQFTLADVAVASYLLYVIQFFPDIDVTPWPHMMKYMKACASRPTYQQAFGSNVQNFVLDRLSTTKSL